MYLLCLVLAYYRKPSERDRVNTWTYYRKSSERDRVNTWAYYRKPSERDRVNTLTYYRKPSERDRVNTVAHCGATYEMSIEDKRRKCFIFVPVYYKPSTEFQTSYVMV
jgi:hypothetical protein